MLKTLLRHIDNNHYGYSDKIQMLKNNYNIECLFLSIDNDLYLSQITFWDNFMYGCEIYDLKKDELLLNENLCLKNNDEQCLKFNDFIETLLKIEKNL
ncbi:MAG: hypothetical protein Q4D68_04610 [Moraxella equi]|nr:hypothetical protein [Moraxella equi]